MYLIADPCHSGTSGISRACELAWQALQARGVPSQLLTKDPGETIEDFARRLAQQATHAHMVEVPEAWAAGRHVPAEKLHVRLHGLHALTALYEGKPHDAALHALEIADITRAARVSAPSQAAAQATQQFAPCAPIVYPHPFPPAFAGDAPRDIDLLFLGRAHVVKGVLFLPKILAALPRRLRITLAGSGMQAFMDLAGHRRNVTVIDRVEGEARTALLARTRVVMLPSLFETFSMVGAEALAAGAHVVAWQGNAVGELAPAPLVHTVQPWNPRTFAAAAKHAVKNYRPTSDLAAILEERSRAFDPIGAAQRMQTGWQPTLPPPQVQYAAWLQWRKDPRQRHGLLQRWWHALAR